MCRSALDHTGGWRQVQEHAKERNEYDELAMERNTKTSRDARQVLANCTTAKPRDAFLTAFFVFCTECHAKILIVEAVDEQYDRMSDSDFLQNTVHKTVTIQRRDA